MSFFKKKDSEEAKIDPIVGNASVAGIALFKCCNQMRVMDYDSLRHTECHKCNTRVFGPTAKYRAKKWNELMQLKANQAARLKVTQ